MTNRIKVGMLGLVMLTVASFTPQNTYATGGKVCVNQDFGDYNVEVCVSKK